MVTIDQLVNILAEKILANQTGGSAADHHVQEVLTIFPSLQFGMDVNPKFTAGPTGIEYTIHLNAFDLLHVEMVHGWLLEPDAEEYDLIGSKTYNQLINSVIEGNDASSSLAANERNPSSTLPNVDELSTKATTGLIINNFLERSSHQLTQFGLTVLHEYLNDGQLMVFFRNNHFNTLTKHNGLLYLLITDYGYANVSTVVWEKFDMLNGDTEYVNGKFEVPPPIQQHVGDTISGQHPTDVQSQVDYQLALQLSQEARPTNQAPASTAPPSAAPTSTQTSTPTPANAHDTEMQLAQQISLQEFQQAQAGSSFLNDTSPLDGHHQYPSDNQFPSAPSDINPTNDATSHSQIFATTQSSPPYATVASLPTPGGPPPVLAMGVPAENFSQEEQDLMMAMQLQREEESERSKRSQIDVRSEQLATAMQTRENERRKKNAARPGAPPRSLPTAPAQSGRKDGCVIS